MTKVCMWQFLIYDPIILVLPPLWEWQLLIMAPVYVGLLLLYDPSMCGDVINV